MKNKFIEYEDNIKEERFIDKVPEPNNIYIPVTKESKIEITQLVNEDDFKYTLQNALNLISYVRTIINGLDRIFRSLDSTISNDSIVNTYCILKDLKYYYEKYSKIYRDSKCNLWDLYIKYKDIVEYKKVQDLINEVKVEE